MEMPEIDPNGRIVALRRRYYHMQVGGLVDNIRAIGGNVNASICHSIDIPKTAQARKLRNNKNITITDERGVQLTVTMPFKIGKKLVYLSGYASGTTGGSTTMTDFNHRSRAVDLCQDCLGVALERLGNRLYDYVLSNKHAKSEAEAEGMTNKLLTKAFIKSYTGQYLSL